jgi:lipopolysaccharide transport system permease protein
MIAAWRDLWQHRAVLWMLIRRDIKVQYRHAALGFAWAVLKPGLLMIILTIVFSHFARFPSEGLPYPLWILAALIPWTFFATALTSGASSLVSHHNLVTKIRFPREILPMAANGAAVFDLVIGVTLLGGLMAYFQVPLTIYALYAVPLLLIMVLWAMAVSLLLSAVNVFYRDVRVVTPLLIQILLFASPVLYPLSVVPEKWRMLYAMNPMAGVIDGLRRSLLMGQAPEPLSVATALASTGVLLAVSYLYFKRVEPEFADVV